MYPLSPPKEALPLGIPKVIHRVIHNPKGDCGYLRVILWVTHGDTVGNLGLTCG
ncbi:hypothetical protein [Klebsiella phage vB_KpnP_cmc355D]|uniref:Uncharacterized protein n=1 Tax=Klebsiella phage vB_KpnP_cmc355D TaxID=3110534 RepID=A0ABZ0ZXP8_9CAUD|nr:hypothetical protein [Klebsiella phage vB_KpnP_cmc355D]